MIEEYFLYWVELIFFSVIPKFSGIPNQIRIEGINTKNRRIMEKII